MSISLTGLASGFDWRSVVDQLTDIERAPQRQLQLDQLDLNEKASSYGSLQTELQVLENRVKDLTATDFFDSRKTTVSDENVLTASSAAEATIGTFDINVTQMATASVHQGTSDIGSGLNATSDVSGLTLSSANFATDVTAGTFTVDGKIVTIATSDSLQDVFDAISTATSGAVTGSYDPATDKISLSSASEIVLGSANDSSNFLTVTQLFNNGTGTVSSANKLGTAQPTAVMDSGNFATAISDGGSGAGEFKVNGVSISFDTASESLNDVLTKINNSSAGVLATFDSTNDRISLTNKTTGDLGVALEDVTGNFLSATGLSGGSLTRGNNLTYTINGGGTLTSFNNAVDSSNSGMSGVSFTALQTGTTSITVGQDNDKIKKGIEDLVSQFNKVQNYIDENAENTTGDDGEVVSGVLAGETEVSQLSSGLRSIAVDTVDALAASLNQLSDIGIITSGYDNSLEVDDSELLSDSLTNNLEKVKALFQDSTDGIATQLETYIDQHIGEDGVIPEKIDLLNEQSADIDDQIAALERVVQTNKESLEASFIAMEQAQQQINNQMQFLLKTFSA